MDDWWAGTFWCARAACRRSYHRLVDKGKFTVSPARRYSPFLLKVPWCAPLCHFSLFQRRYHYFTGLTWLTTCDGLNLLLDCLPVFCKPLCQQAHCDTWFDTCIVHPPTSLQWWQWNLMSLNESNRFDKSTLPPSVPSPNGFVICCRILLLKQSQIRVHV